MKFIWIKKKPVLHIGQGKMIHQGQEIPPGSLDEETLLAYVEKGFVRKEDDSPVETIEESPASEPEPQVERATEKPAEPVVSKVLEKPKKRKSVRRKKSD